MGVRKRLILSLGGFLVLINLAFWVFYYLANDRLERDLATKLTGVCLVVAQSVRGDALAALDPGDEDTRTYRRIRGVLDTAREAFELNRVLIVGEDGRLLVDTDSAPIGNRLYRIEGMNREMAAALAGSAAATVVYRGGDGRPYKSAFAPVTDAAGEVVAVLVAEASAEFLRQIGFLRTVIVLIAIASVVALLALGAAISWSVVAPLLKLVGAARRVQQGTYEAGVEPSGAIEVKTLAAAFNDMAESIRRNEERLREMAGREARRARNIEQYAEYILESIANGIVSVDKDGVVRVCNAEARRLLGCRETGVVGVHYRKVPELSPVEDLITRSLDRGEVVRDRHLELAREGTGRFDVTVSSSPLLRTRETGVAVTAVITDQTRMVELQEEVKRSETLAAVGELAAHVAHEVRNPLGSMRLFVDLLARDTVDDEKRRYYREKLSAEIERLEGIVTQFLEYAAPARIAPVEFDLAELVRDAATLALTQGDGEVVEIAGNYDQIGSCRVRADRNQLLQLLLNLIINARNAMPEDGRIAVDLDAGDGECVRVSVADTGVGIDPQDVEHVFEPFFTTRSGGTGLGLAMVQRIVDNHGGHADIESTPGRGTTVTVTLPIGLTDRDLGSQAKREEEEER